MRRSAAFGSISLLVCAALLLLHATAAHSFIPEMTSTSNGPVPYRWGGATQWNLNPNHGTNVSGSRAVGSVIQASFNTWTGAPNQALQVSRGPDSSATATTAGVNLICFVCSDPDFGSNCSSKGSTDTLAVTMTSAEDQTQPNPGQILNASILFNPCVSFSTDSPVAADSSSQDLQVVATHEIGHFFGLDHSGVVRSVMFPSAGGSLTLSYDDVAGISLLYPKATPDVVTGTIEGTVRNTAGAGVFEAHVFADSTTADTPFAASIRKSPIATFTRPDGTYTITGVPPGSYVVWAEPLDGPMSPKDIDSYASVYGQAGANTSFTTRPH